MKEIRRVEGSPNEKISVNKLIIDSLEWLEGLGVTIKYKEEIMAFFAKIRMTFIEHKLIAERV